MSELLAHLGRDTLPKQLVETFIDWCIWEQARPALLTILEKNDLGTDEIRRAKDLPTLLRLTIHANNRIHHMPAGTKPLGLSAAEAGTFEFSNMMRAATEDHWDAEAVAFFASRVCGWAGWAATNFAEPTQKINAEKQACQEQERALTRLLAGV